MCRWCCFLWLSYCCCCYYCCTIYMYFRDTFSACNHFQCYHGTHSVAICVKTYWWCAHCAVKSCHFCMFASFSQCSLWLSLLSALYALSCAYFKLIPSAHNILFYCQQSVIAVLLALSPCISHSFSSLFVKFSTVCGKGGGLYVQRRPSHAQSHSNKAFLRNNPRLTFFNWLKRFNEATEHIRFTWLLSVCDAFTPINF